MTDHPPGTTKPLGGTARMHEGVKGPLVPVTEVTPYPGNPRRGDQDAITASIRDLGLYAGIVCQRSTGHIVVGNHRYRALLELGATKVPVTWVDVDDQRAAAIVVRDNGTSDRAENDDHELLALLDSLASDDLLALSGYTDEEYADLTALLAPPSLDDVVDDAGDLTDDDLLETIKVRVMPATARLWRAAREAIGDDDDVSADTALVQAVYRALVIHTGGHPNPDLLAPPGPDEAPVEPVAAPVGDEQGE